MCHSCLAWPSRSSSGLLSFNDLVEDGAPPFVEVIVLSKNDPDTGLRVMRSVAQHGLNITRAVFMQGRSPYKFIPSFEMALFLSADEADVLEAVASGHPAGRVLATATEDDDGADLRIAFDFDGVLADDSAGQVFQSGAIEAFHQNETERRLDAHSAGPLVRLLTCINRIQRREEQIREADSDYRLRMRVALVTARNAPSHERAVRS